VPKDFNPTDDAFFIDPDPTYRFFRETDAVHWSASVNGWFIFRHDDVTAVLKDSSPARTRACAQKNVLNISQHSSIQK
jgi:hypothetical protein